MHSAWAIIRAQGDDNDDDDSDDSGVSSDDGKGESRNPSSGNLEHYG